MFIVNKFKENKIFRIFVIFVFAFILCGVTSSFAMKSYYKLDFSTGLVTATTLNVRSGPGVQYKVIATVNKKGVVKGISEGLTFININKDDKFGFVYEYVTVTVKKPYVNPTDIRLSSNSLNLGVGDTHTLKATVLPDDVTDSKVTWTSSNSKIASVDSNGNVKGIKAGTVTIKANCNGKSASFKITIKTPTK